MLMIVRLCAVFALLFVTNLYAQDQPQSRSVDEVPRTVDKPLVVNLKDVQQAQEVPEPPDPPAGTAAWTLQVYTTGGFTGTGVGSVIVSSNGQMSCGPAPCATPVAAAVLSPFTTTIGSIIEAAWIRRTPSGLCRDCVQTTVTLKRRDGDVVHRYVASWDDSQAVAPELRELRRLAFELRSARAAR